MQRSQSHKSTARKKLLQYEETIKREQSQSGYLGRTLSKQHSKLMESILREQLQKQESERVIKKQYLTRGYDSNSSYASKTPQTSGKKMLDIELTQYATTFKPLKTSRSNRYEEIKIQMNDESDELNNGKNSSQVQYYKDTDQIRSARQNELMQVKRVGFQFSFLSHIIEVLIGYGIFIGILYLIKLGSFPYFEILFVIGLTSTIQPWKMGNLILPLTTLPIIIVNNYLGLSSLTYVEILVCYLGTMAFNEKYKVKVVFIVVLVVQVVFGIFVFPNLYQLLRLRPQVYYYIFPLFMFLLRNLVQLFYWIVGYSQTLFLQIPLFLIGLEYGTILTIPLGQIEFWYLILFYTLQLINDRTHFVLKAIINLITFCFPQLKTTPTPYGTNKNNNILPAHWNGFTCIHSFHLIFLIYILTQLPLSSSPYNSTLNLSFYLQNNEWYKPIIIWALISVYEIMCIVLERKKQNIMLIGYTNNSWYMTICRGLMLVIGLWMFYIGFGISAYSLQRLI